MSNRIRGRNAFESTLNGAISAGATSILLASASGLTGPGYLVIEPEVPAKREYIRFSSVTTNTLNGVTRGLDGSAAGAQAHDSGVRIRAVAVHQWLDVIFTDIETLEAADAGHFGGTDTADHPEATVSVRGFMSAADKSKLDGIASGAVANHDLLSGVSANDHHNQQHVLSGADHTGQVSDSQVPASAVTQHQAALSIALGQVTGHTKAAHDALAIDHGSLTGLGDDDHPQYLLASGARAMAGNLAPDGDATRDLGDATNSWRRVYTHEIFDETGAEVIDTGQRRLVGAWNAEDTLSPSTDITHDLGTPTLSWRRLYVAALYNEDGTGIIDASGPTLTGAPWFATLAFFADGGAYATRSGAVPLWTDRPDGVNTQGLFEAWVGQGSSLRGHLAADGDWTTLSGSYGTISDESTKENVQDARPYLADLKRVKVRKYQQATLGVDHLGFVAQEVAAVFPGLVGEVEGGLKTVKTSLFIPMLLTAVQELDARLVALGG